jgi:hypothetical protein
VSAAPIHSIGRGPIPWNAPASPAPAEAAVILTPATAVNTCERAPAGAYALRAASVAVKNGPTTMPTAANAAIASG